MLTSRLGRLLHDHVSIGAAESERTDARQRRTARCRPRTRTRLHANREFVERYMRIGLLEVQARRNLRIVERERDLDQPRDPSRRLAVSDIRLDRTDRAKIPRRTTVGQHPAQRARLDRIAQQSAGAVRLDVLNVSR